MLAGGLAAAGVAVSALSTQVACTDHSCEPPLNPINVWGTWLDDHTWQTNPINGNWVSYPSVATLTLCLNSEPPPGAGKPGLLCRWDPDPAAVADSGVPPAAHNTLASMQAWVSIDPVVESPMGNNIFATAAGNLAEWENLSQNDAYGYFIQLINGTCSPYYVTVTLTFAETGDAGTADGEAGLDEGGADSGSDAATD